MKKKCFRVRVASLCSIAVLLLLTQVGRFWRYLLLNFPETVDFLTTCDPEHRENFGAFAEVM